MLAVTDSIIARQMEMLFLMVSPAAMPLFAGRHFPELDVAVIADRGLPGLGNVLRN